MRFISKTRWLLALILLSLLPRNQVVSETELGLKNETRTAGKEAHRWGRDPFYRDRPKGNNALKNEAEQAEQQEVDFLLSAIIFKEGSSVAIINNQIVRAGDKLKVNKLQVDTLGVDKLETNVVVSRILPHSVFLREGKRTIVLKVKPFGRK